MNSPRRLTALALVLGALVTSPVPATPRRPAAQKELEKALRFEARAHSKDASVAVAALLRTGFLADLLAKADEVRARDARIAVDPRVLEAVDRFFGAEGRVEAGRCGDDPGCQAYRIKKVLLEGESASPAGPIEPVWRVTAEHQEEPDPAMVADGHDEVWVFRSLTVDPETGRVEPWWGR